MAGTCGRCAAPPPIAAPAGQPLFHYPYAEWRESLETLAAASDPDPHFGHALEFTNPADGGAVMPTISAHVRLLPAGFVSRPRASTDGTIFVVVEGRGTALVEGKEIALQERDTLVVPSWRELVLQADSDLVLFGYSRPHGAGEARFVSRTAKLMG